MRHHVSTRGQRAERRPQPANRPATSRGTRQAFGRRESALRTVSRPASVPPGEWRRISRSRLRGNCPPERPTAYQPLGRRVYSRDEGRS